MRKLQVIEGELHIKILSEDFVIGPGEVALFNPHTFHMLYSVQSHCILLTIQAAPSFSASHYPAIRSIRFDTANATSSIPFKKALEMPEIGKDAMSLFLIQNTRNFFDHLVFFQPEFNLHPPGRLHVHLACRIAKRVFFINRIAPGFAVDG